MPPTEQPKAPLLTVENHRTRGHLARKSREFSTAFANFSIAVGLPIVKIVPRKDVIGRHTACDVRECWDAPVSVADVCAGPVLATGHMLNGARSENSFRSVL